MFRPLEALREYQVGNGENPIGNREYQFGNLQRGSFQYAHGYHLECLRQAGCQPEYSVSDLLRLILLKKKGLRPSLGAV